MADFWREACLLSQLHHPNVVAFYGVVPDGPGGTFATVTEYMVNGSLKQVLQRKDRYRFHIHMQCPQRVLIIFEKFYQLGTEH